MLWRKKKANPQSVLGIVALATPFSYKVHDVIMQNDKEYGYFQEKSEALFKHVVAAGAMIAIIELENEYYSLYFSDILDGLEAHYSGIGELCADLNEFIRSKYHVNARLESVVLEWLHRGVGTGDTSNQIEVEMLAGGVKAIFDVYYDWFEKNNMPIK
ncbi:hypothetical protein [Cohnella soli]|uniref:Uncharacterized protein n=1 Tax=Cohnella soli TaxID=425005 RepID=A0ABW0HKD2_9BACL